MAAFEIGIPKGDYKNKDAVSRVIDYICRLDKPEQVGGMGVFPLYVEDMVNQFLAVKRIYHKEEGKQVFHIFISFEKSLGFTVDEVMEMGYEIAAYWGYDRQVMFAVHDDTQNIHIHRHLPLPCPVTVFLNLRDSRTVRNKALINAF